MNSKDQTPLRLFFNPFQVWNELALKTGQAIWASAHAAAVRASPQVRVAVIPTAEMTQQKAQMPVAPAVAAPRKSAALVRKGAKAVRSRQEKRRKTASAKRRSGR